MKGGGSVLLNCYVAHKNVCALITPHNYPVATLGRRKEQRELPKSQTVLVLEAVSVSGGCDERSEKGWE